MEELNNFLRETGGGFDAIREKALQGLQAISDFINITDDPDNEGTNAWNTLYKFVTENDKDYLMESEGLDNLIDDGVLKGTAAKDAEKDFKEWVDTGAKKPDTTSITKTTVSKSGGDNDKEDVADLSNILKGITGKYQ